MPGSAQPPRSQCRRRGRGQAVAAAAASPAECQSRGQVRVERSSRWQPPSLPGGSAGSQCWRLIPPQSVVTVSPPDSESDAESLSLSAAFLPFGVKASCVLRRLSAEPAAGGGYRARTSGTAAAAAAVGPADGGPGPGTVGRGCDHDGHGGTGPELRAGPLPVQRVTSQPPRHTGRPLRAGGGRHRDGRGRGRGVTGTAGTRRHGDSVTRTVIS